MKSILQFIAVGIVLFVIHQWVLVPVLDIEDTVPVVLQHILLGGFSLGIYLVSSFIAENYLQLVGFTILGFLFLKIISVVIFMDFYAEAFESQIKLKYLLLGNYLIYLLFLIVKIVPLLDILPTKDSSQ